MATAPPRKPPINQNEKSLFDGTTAKALGSLAVLVGLILAFLQVYGQPKWMRDFRDHLNPADLKPVDGPPVDMTVADPTQGLREVKIYLNPTTGRWSEDATVATGTFHVQSMYFVSEELEWFENTGSLNRLIEKAVNESGLKAFLESCGLEIIKPTSSGLESPRAEDGGEPTPADQAAATSHTELDSIKTTTSIKRRQLGLISVIVTTDLRCNTAGAQEDERRVMAVNFHLASGLALEKYDLNLNAKLRRTSCKAPRVYYLTNADLQCVSDTGERGKETEWQGAIAYEQILDDARPELRDLLTVLPQLRIFPPPTSLVPGAPPR